MKEQEESNEILNKLSQWFGLDEFRNEAEEKVEQEESAPGMMEVVATAINIMQDRITKSRMAGDPPDIILNPDLTHLGLMEFYRGDEAIKEGRAVVDRKAKDILALVASS